MANTYPMFYTSRLRLQQEARAFVELCLVTPLLQSSKHADCEQARVDASRNARLGAIELTLMELLDHFNILKSVFTKDSTISYILIRTIDNIISSSVMLVTFVGILLLWALWNIQTGPVQQYRWLQVLQQQYDMGDSKHTAIPISYKQKQKEHLP
jgi:hypothetical protein